MDQQQQQPTADYFREFAALRARLFAATPAELAERVSALKSHRVNHWLAAQSGYQAAVASLSRKPSFQSSAPPAFFAAYPDWELLYFATLVAQCVAYYLDLLNAPDERKGVITSKDLQEGTAAADVLRRLIERGLVLPEKPGRALDLYDLLDSIPEATDDLVMTSKRAGDHVPTMSLIRLLALLLHSHYGDMMPAVIYHVVSMVEPAQNRDSLERTIKRHLATLRGDT